MTIVICLVIPGSGEAGSGPLAICCRVVKLRAIDMVWAVGCGVQGRSDVDQAQISPHQVLIVRT